MCPHAKFEVWFKSQELFKSSHAEFVGKLNELLANRDSLLVNCSYCQAFGNFRGVDFFF